MRLPAQHNRKLDFLHLEASFIFCLDSRAPDLTPKTASFKRRSTRTSTTWRELRPTFAYRVPLVPLQGAPPDARNPANHPNDEKAVEIDPGLDYTQEKQSQVVCLVARSGETHRSDIELSVADTD
ncbi:MAG: hypothetical protein O7G84_05095 [Gammaproteobacteria bacterium]|nr:hypothetical protein [Gammaproteobacteria bacterium]